MENVEDKKNRVKNEINKWKKCPWKSNSSKNKRNGWESKQVKKKNSPYGRLPFYSRHCLSGRSNPPWCKPATNNSSSFTQSHLPNEILPFSPMEENSPRPPPSFLSPLLSWIAFSAAFPSSDHHCRSSSRALHLSGKFISLMDLRFRAPDRCCKKTGTRGGHARERERPKTTTTRQQRRFGFSFGVLLQ